MFAKRLVVFLVCILMLLPIANAHSGRTDSSGGHKDNRNASGLGSYHYHHGYGPHLHPGGVCPYTAIKTRSVKIEAPEKEIVVGDRVKLVSTISPAGASYGIDKWTSSDESVAKVSSSGVLTALSIGTVTITAISDDNVKGTLKIVISEIPVVDIVLPFDKITIEIGETTSIEATVSPDDATDKTLSFSIDNECIDRVMQGVLGVEKGISQVMITAASGVSKIVEIEVIGKSVKHIEVERPSDKVIVGDVLQIKADVQPGDAEDKTLTWSSSDEAIATVSETGEITAIKEGRCDIVVEAVGGIVEQFTLKVDIIPVIRIVFPYEAITLDKNQTAEIEYSIVPANATYKDIVFSIEDETLAGVSADGVITAIKEGETKVVLHVANTGKDYTFDLIVNDPYKSTDYIAPIAAVAVIGGAAGVVLSKKKKPLPKGAEGE